MSNFSRRSVAAALCLTAFFGGLASPLLAGQMPALTGGDGSYDRIRERGHAIVGTSNDQPFNFVNPRTKLVEGIDADMMRYVLEKIGVPKSEMLLSEFSALIPSLMSKRLDFVADAMTVTKKRQEQIGFTDGWYRYGETLLVAKGNPHKIGSLEDLTKGLRVASYLGTNLQDWVDELGTRGAIASSYPGVPELLKDLQIGRIDAAVVDAPVAAFMMSESPDLGAAVEVAEGYVAKESGIKAAGVRKEDVDLTQAINWALHEMKAEGADLVILKKWGLNEANRAP
jgi:polar amino acid transport system substrate-binding protein